MSYISSNANRFYTALESAYGGLASVSAANRIPAGKLTIRQKLTVTERRDKTGSRTFTGLPAGGQKQTSFELKTYLTNWADAERGCPLWAAVSGGFGRTARNRYTRRINFRYRHYARVCGATWPERRPGRGYGD